MRKNYKQLIRELLESKGITNYSFSTLPDCKAVHTLSSIGFSGCMSSKTWPQLYKRLQKELQTL